jgi:hypothetical protein
MLYMKIVRLGNTEANLLFITYLLKNEILPSSIRFGIMEKMMSYIKWLYTTSGYYDKTVPGHYFDQDILNNNFFEFIKHLQTSVSGCKEAQFYIHETLLKLFDIYKKNFFKAYDIKNAKLLNGSLFCDRINSVFDSIKNRKVLVISSFDGLIKQQYTSGNIYKIYENFPILKQLEVYKFPYCFHNNGPHANYFETLDHVYNDIRKIDFDIAILGCGCYGHMLCHKIHSDLKKDAIYIGGNIQTMFGILSTREKNANTSQVNEFWITEIPDEYKPKDYEKIEDGCYW